MKRLLALVGGAILVLLVSLAVSANAAPTDPADGRDKERQRLLAQTLEANAVVGKAVLSLSQHKELDPIEKAQLASAVRNLEQTAQSYRRTVQ